MEWLLSKVSIKSYIVYIWAFLSKLLDKEDLDDFKAFNSATFLIAFYINYQNNIYKIL